VQEVGQKQFEIADQPSDQLSKSEIALKKLAMSVTVLFQQLSVYIRARRVSILLGLPLVPSRSQAELAKLIPGARSSADELPADDRDFCGFSSPPTLNRRQSA